MKTTYKNHVLEVTDDIKMVVKKSPLEFANVAFVVAWAITTVAQAILYLAEVIKEKK